MNLGILNVSFRATGVNSVLSALGRINSQGQRTQAMMNGLVVAAGAFTTAAGAIAYASIQAYDSFARFEMGAKSLLGVLEGKNFARAIQQFSVPSAFDPALLRQGAQGLISTGMGAGRSKSVLEAVTNLAAAGGSTNEQIARTLMALRQVQGKGGNVRAEEINTQLAESLPLLIADVRKITGRDPIGMKVNDFFDAVMTAGNRRAGAQQELARVSPMIAVENFWQSIQNTLIPTGKALATTLSILLAPLNSLVGVFGVLNETTRGLLGLGVIGALLYTASAALSGYIRLQISSMTAMEIQTNMSYMTAKALATLAKSAVLASNSVGGAGVMDDLLGELDLLRKGSSNKSTIQALAGLLNPKTMIGKLGGASKLIKPAASAGWNALKGVMTVGKIAKFTAVLTIVIAAIEVLPRLFSNLGKIFGKLWESLSSAWESFKTTPLGSVLSQMFETLGTVYEAIISILALDWLVKLMGIDETGSANAEKIAGAATGATSNAVRPIRRSDSENWFYARMGEIR